MGIGAKYISALEQAYRSRGQAADWEYLECVAEGITAEGERALRAEFPLAPDTLVEILRRFDGTYWRDYGGKEVSEYFFGSDVDDGEYPYYLYSLEQILELADGAENFADLFYYFCEEPMEDYGIFIDERIGRDPKANKWLCIADCMNNGGTSSLYIDFTPSKKGKSGQIVRFLHDPDRLDVIADSLDELLEMLMEGGMRFIHEDD